MSRCRSNGRIFNGAYTDNATGEIDRRSGKRRGVSGSTGTVPLPSWSAQADHDGGGRDGAASGFREAVPGSNRKEEKISWTPWLTGLFSLNEHFLLDSGRVLG